MRTADRWGRTQWASEHGGGEQLHRGHPVLGDGPWGAECDWPGRAATEGMGKRWQWFVDWNAGMKEAVMTMIQWAHLSPCHPRIPETYFLPNISSCPPPDVSANLFVRPLRSFLPPGVVELNLVLPSFLLFVLRGPSNSFSAWRCSYTERHAPPQITPFDRAASCNTPPGRLFRRLD